MRCDDIVDLLPQVVDGTEKANADVRRHVEGCLRCQAELVQYRKLLKVLHSLRTDVLEPAPGVLTGIFSKLEEAGERNAIRSLLAGRRAAYAGGIAVATLAAGAAGAIVVANRGRKKVRLAG